MWRSLFKRTVQLTLNKWHTDLNYFGYLCNKYMCLRITRVRGKAESILYQRQLEQTAASGRLLNSLREISPLHVPYKCPRHSAISPAGISLLRQGVSPSADLNSKHQGDSLLRCCAGQAYRSTVHMFYSSQDCRQRVLENMTHMP